MTNENLLFLKDVLSVQTVSQHEERMIQFLQNYLTEKGYSHYIDASNNIYVTKGVSDIYPCILAHTDTVHYIEPLQPLHIVEINKRRPHTFGMRFNDVEPRHCLTGVNNFGESYGIGGDDKCGVYVCLRLLEEFDNIKAAFFVSEEIGCLGSMNADPTFFENVGYSIQFDAPGNRLVTEICSGIRLFERDSCFFEIINNTLSNYDDFLYQQHPFTDICQLKKKFNHACLNISCGYYEMHKNIEFVDVEDVERTVIIGKDLIDKLGYFKYEYFVDYETQEREEKIIMVRKK